MLPSGVQRVEPTRTFPVTKARDSFERQKGSPTPRRLVWSSGDLREREGRTAVGQNREGPKMSAQGCRVRALEVCGKSFKSLGLIC